MKALIFLSAAILVGGVTFLRAAQPEGTAGRAAPYYIIFLRPDPNRKTITQADRERIQAAHMANIRTMADDGVLVAAGPMDDHPVTISGIFVFKAGSLSEACRIAALDPTVVEKRNTADVHAWLGPEGIGTNYFRWKRENPAAEDEMASHVLCILKHGPGPGGGPQAVQDCERLVPEFHVWWTANRVLPW